MALSTGVPDAFGWSGVQALLSDIYDAINVNTQATGHWKNNKPPDFPRAVRPGDTPDEPAPETEEPSLVKALYLQFQR